MGPWAATYVPSARAVIDAVDDARLVVGDKQCAIRRDDHVDRPAGGVVALQPALRKRLIARYAAVLQLHDRDAIARLRIAVPRAMLGDEDRPLVVLRKLAPGVEAHAE